MPPQILPFLAILAIGITAGIVSWLAQNRRRQALAEFAARHGFAFDPDPDPDHDDRYAQFEIFRRGHARVARNTIEGTIELFGRPCTIRCGDFRYRTRSGGNRRQTHRFSYLIVHPPWATPALLVRPEGLFDKVAGAFGFDDIDFESAEFSRRFYVKSSDKRFAYDVLHPRMMELLLATSPPMIDIEDGALCLSDGRRRWAPEEFAAKMEFVKRFCDLWPRHLLQELDA